jgi:peptidoglycan-N-acetylglucosamine deacetylase
MDEDQRTRLRSTVRGRRTGALILAAGIAVIVAAAVGYNHARATSKAGAIAAEAAPRAGPTSVRSPGRSEDANAAINAVLAYTPFVKEGGDRGRDVALTFDDGPGPYTPGVLSVLEQLHVHATFFEIGEMLRYFSAAAVRELRDGDVIGDHTETHPEMTTLSAHDQHEQLFEQIARIELLGGPRPVLFRPPYGSYDATTMRELQSLHLLMVLWSDDTEDYLQPGVSAIVSRALAGAHPGAIILMHDAGGTRSQTIAALPTIIHRLRARGFHLVTVPELLRDDPPAPHQALPPSLRGD